MRVIAGIAKGMRLKVPRSDAVRPTSDMVREAIFDILGERPVGARVLDLFAGSGALAIEALSRGAESAMLNERSAGCLPFIRENLEHTRFAEQTEVIHGDVFREVRNLDAAGEQFDLVLADPPYRGTVERGQPVRQSSRRAARGGAHGAPPSQEGQERGAPAPAQRALQLLAETAILQNNAVLVIEHATGLALPGEAGRLQLTTTRKYGSTSVSFYRSA
jgi:16S rRNA (guanine966-N2)-methyltransferase